MLNSPCSKSRYSGRKRVLEDLKMPPKPFAILFFVFLHSIAGDKVPCETISVCEAMCGPLHFTFNQSVIKFP